MNHRLVLILASALAISLPTLLQAQSDPVRFRIYLTRLDSGAGTVRFRSARFGVHPDAQFGYDGTGRTGPDVHNFFTHGYTDHWFETETDSTFERDDWISCAFAVEIRLNNDRDPSLNPLSDGQSVNIHQFRDTTQVDTFKMVWCWNNGLGHYDYRPQIITWPSVLSSYCDSMKMILNTEFPIKTIDMLKQSSWTMYPWYDITITGDPIDRGLIIMYGPKVPPGPPGPVTLTFPKNGSTVPPSSATLQWTAVPDAYYYKVQVSTDSLFTGTLFYNDSMTTTSIALAGLDSSTVYFWRVLVSNPFGFSYYQNQPNSFHVSGPTGVAEESKTYPATFALSPNYPNPFNPTTSIRYQLPGGERSAASFYNVSLKIYDILGQVVATLVNESRAAGEYTVSWEASKFPNGVYFYRLEANAIPPGRARGFLSVKTMILMK